jgi:hypothetical protein
MFSIHSLIVSVAGVNQNSGKKKLVYSLDKEDSNKQEVKAAFFHVPPTHKSLLRGHHHGLFSKATRIQVTRRLGKTRPLIPIEVSSQ